MRLVALLVALTALVACTRRPAPVPAPTTSTETSSGPDSVSRTHVTTVTAVVADIDVAGRLVTLRDADGTTRTLRVDEAVRNLPQVRKGDHVITRYEDSLVVQVKKPGEATPGETTDLDVMRAPAGAKPAGAVFNTATVVARVAAIDKATRSIVLAAADGRRETLKVQDPANLDKVKVGDLLEFTFTEAVAIAVEPAPGR